MLAHCCAVISTHDSVKIVITTSRLWLRASSAARSAAWVSRAPSHGLTCTHVPQSLSTAVSTPDSSESCCLQGWCTRAAYVTEAAHSGVLASQRCVPACEEQQEYGCGS